MTAVPVGHWGGCDGWWGPTIWFGSPSGFVLQPHFDVFAGQSVCLAVRQYRLVVQSSFRQDGEPEGRYAGVVCAG